MSTTVPDRYRNSKGLVWVNVASSVYVLEDFVNIDNHVFLRWLWAYPFFKWAIPKRYHSQFEEYRAAKAKAPLLRQDCRAPLPFPDASVDHVLCSHFLEHIYSDEAVACLKDFRRVLKPGGTAHIIVPDLRVLIDKYIQRNKEGDPDAPGQLIEGAMLSQRSRPSAKFRWMEMGGGFGLQHRWMYDTASMSRVMKDVGFTLLDGNDTPSKTYREGDGSVHLVGLVQ